MADDENELLILPEQPAPVFGWPTDADRVAIVGQTGSGKTQAGVFQLSMRSFDQMPWIIVDTKRDELINKIGGLQETGYSRLPDRPGLYIIRTNPQDSEQIDGFLWRVWERGNIGLYMDEGYNIPQGDAYKGIMTQGRSLKIPTITLSQRPVDMSVYTWTEAQFFQMFWLNDSEDRKTMKRRVTFDVDEQLPRHWSHWYDVNQRAHWRLKPVPGEAEILATFRRRLLVDINKPAPLDPVDVAPGYRVI